MAMLWHASYGGDPVHRRMREALAPLGREDAGWRADRRPSAPAAGLAPATASSLRRGLAGRSSASPPRSSADLIMRTAAIVSGVIASRAEATRRRFRCRDQQGRCNGDRKGRPRHG